METTKGFCSNARTNKKAKASFYQSTILHKYMLAQARTSELLPETQCCMSVDFLHSNKLIASETNRARNKHCVTPHVPLFRVSGFVKILLGPVFGPVSEPIASGFSPEVGPKRIPPKAGLISGPNPLAMGSERGPKIGPGRGLKKLEAFIM